MISYNNQVGGKKKRTPTPKQLKALERGRKKLQESREKKKSTGKDSFIICRSKCKLMGERTQKQRLKKNKCYINCKFN